MKIRNGFVSNSSSSSFIIAIRKAEPRRHCGRSDPDFLALVNNANDGDTEVDRLGREAVMEYLREWLRDYGIDPMTFEGTDHDSEDLVAAYQAVQQEDWTGWELATVSLSHHNETIDAALQQSANNGSIRILYGED